MLKSTRSARQPVLQPAKRKNPYQDSYFDKYPSLSSLFFPSARTRTHTYSSLAHTHTLSLSPSFSLSLTHTHSLTHSHVHTHSRIHIHYARTFYQSKCFSISHKSASLGERTKIAKAIPHYYFLFFKKEALSFLVVFGGEGLLERLHHTR